MSENNNSDLGAFLAGFVIGGLVGAATALILAPQSGPETRAQIAAKGEELRVAGQHQLDDARGRVLESTSQIQEKARIVLDEGKSKVSEAIEREKVSTSDKETESTTQEESQEAPEEDATA